jgi:hypothetical protein
VRIEFGLSSESLDCVAEDSSMDGVELSTEHSVPLEGPAPEPEYFYRGRVETGDGQLFFSAVLSFDTTAALDLGLTNYARPEMGALIAYVSSYFGDSED